MEVISKIQNNEEEIISVNNLLNDKNTNQIHNERNEINVGSPQTQSSDKPKIIFKNNFTLEFINSSIQTKFEEELYKFSIDSVINSVSFLNETSFIPAVTALLL